jgi:hypothetical protein
LSKKPTGGLVVSAFCEPCRRSCGKNQAAPGLSCAGCICGSICGVNCGRFAARFAADLRPPQIRFLPFPSWCWSWQKSRDCHYWLPPARP